MNNNHVVQVSVQVYDKATDPLRKITEQTQRMASNFRQIGSSLGAFSNHLGRLSNTLERTANTMYRLNLATSGMQRLVRNTGFIAAGATAALGVQSTSKAIDFEYTTRKMQTRMDTSPQVRKQIEDYILNDLNKQTMFKPTQIADLGVLLGQAGINNTKDMKSMLKTTTFFSESVDADVQTAGEMIISAAKGFDISMQDSSKITDKLTVALNQSLLHVEEMPHAIGELSGRAKMFGQSLDSSLVALMTGSDQGMSAAQTSQDFLHGLSQLSLAGRNDVLYPRRKSYYEKLGIDTSFFDTDKKQLKEFPEIIASLEKSMANRGLMPDREKFYQEIAKNGGHIPDGLINKMSAMPLISRVFGAAGQAPLLMGLQSRYDEVDKLTGEKTGKTFYGSDALKKMREDLKNSAGTVNKVHAEMADTTKFHLGVLSGAWEAAQIKITDDFLPVIKVATNEITDFLNGANKPGGLDRFNQSIKNSADNIRKSNPVLADMVEKTGQLAVNGIKIGSTLGPTMTQIGGAAKNNLLDANWGNSLWTLPYHAMKNGLNFIGDATGDNPEADKAISQLPPELQDQAKLTRKLVQGGVTLVAAGALIKIIELAFRSASVLVKTGKAGLDLSKWLLELLGMGSGKGKGGALGKLAGTMAIQANVVNVYGAVVNGGGAGGGAGGGLPTPIPGGLPPRGLRMPKKIPRLVKGAGLLSLLMAGYSMYDLSAHPDSYFGPNVSDADKGENLRELSGNTPDASNAWGYSIALADKNAKKNGKKPLFDFQPHKGLFAQLNDWISGPQKVGPGSGLPGTSGKELHQYLASVKKKDEDNAALLNVSKQISAMGDPNAALAKGFNDVNSSLQNVKIENKIAFTPQINISGELKDKINWSISTIGDADGNGLLDIFEKGFTFNGKRFAKE